MRRTAAARRSLPKVCGTAPDSIGARTGHIYATDNGRDLLGDDFPPCELNQVTEGAHYGWPFANGDGLADPDFGEGNEALVASSASPVYNYPAHNAPLGIE